MAGPFARVSFVSPWSPGFSCADDWRLWARGAKPMQRSADSPKIEFTDPLFRRRLSQISRMTIQVAHDLIQKTGDSSAPQAFISNRGEIAREFSVSMSLARERSVSPAAFSLSVFNTPISVATIALGLRAGYSSIYPSKGGFRSAFAAACAGILCGDDKKIMLVYADELPPAQYNALGTQDMFPFAFAAQVSSDSCGAGVRVGVWEGCPPTAEAFLKKLIEEDETFK